MKTKQNIIDIVEKKLKSGKVCWEPTQKGLNRRKTLPICAHKKTQIYSKFKKKHNQNKVKVFIACVPSIFMYYSELWTLTKKHGVTK